MIRQISASALLLLTLIAIPLPRARAIPAYARRFRVSCSTCHTIAPRLNATGLSFQANFFNWSRDAQISTATGIKALPVSAILTGSYEKSQGESATMDYRAFELYPSSGFIVGSKRQGGYFGDLIVHDKSGETPSFTFEQLYAGLPLNSKLAVIAGQTTGLLYQYDPINSLTDTLPGALDAGAGEFTFLEAHPTVRLDWFSGRGGSSANGDTVAVGVPFEGGLALNNHTKIGASQGVYAQAFHRQNGLSYGFFHYSHSSDHRTGVLVTKSMNDMWHFMAARSQGHDSSSGSSTLSTLEAEWDSKSNLALTGRWEWSGSQSYPVAALTYLPDKKGILRLTLETAQQKGARHTALFARVQL